MAPGVLAYLLSPPPSRQILFGFRATEATDEEHLQRFSDILFELHKDATLNALYTALMLPFKWRTDGIYDVINPFGDDREVFYRAMWIFNIEHDILFHINRDGRRRISLSLFRERHVTFVEMEPFDPPIPHPPFVDPIAPYWKPDARIATRTRAFTHRLLRDFNCQWRHILRNDYNSVTLRFLARAIIRLSTLDFDIREETQERHCNPRPRPDYVWVLDLPAWEPFESDLDIVRVGSIYVVLCQSIQEGVLKARQHVSSRHDTNIHNSMDPHYLILSVKHIVLGRVTSPSILEHTVPEPLINGNDDLAPLSDLALDYLVWATTTARESIPTPIQRLPIEVQDIILGYLSAGTVAAAKIGCLLGLGLPFLWKDGHRKVELQETYTHRSLWSPIESQVWFGEHTSGIVYKGQWLSTAG